ncbi:hypothetical protein [uncultured Thiodictyon sp.]|uniref:hypothetical protein n=1 Tax=uncultured Thiodictyon sp. TaxID=1846217 RepID=UPI0025EFA7FB|nr:hypothetical protein [uncultured Thiodictyon sp.]
MDKENATTTIRALIACIENHKNNESETTTVQNAVNFIYEILILNEIKDFAVDKEIRDEIIACVLPLNVRSTLNSIRVANTITDSGTIKSTYNLDGSSREYWSITMIEFILLKLDYPLTDFIFENPWRYGDAE